MAGRTAEFLAVSEAVAFVIFKSSVGEMDAYAPLLHQLKRKRPSWGIIAVFLNHRLHLQAQQSAVYEHVAAASDLLIAPDRPLLPQSNRLRSKLRAVRVAVSVWKKLERVAVRRLRLKRWFRPGDGRGDPSYDPAKAVDLKYSDLRPILDNIAPDHVRIILKNHTRDNEFIQKLQDQFGKSVVVAHPNSTLLRPRTNLDFLGRATAVDLLLLSSENDHPFYDRLIDNTRPQPAQVEFVGFPRYDHSWIRRLITEDELRRTQEAEAARKFKYIFTLFTRNASDDVLPASLHEYLVRSTAEVVLGREDTFLLIKPHPRELANSVAALLSEFDTERWMLSRLQALQIASLSDFVISMFSSCVLDSLALGKPTVEFFQYVTNYKSFVKYPGRTTSVFRDLGLAVPADTKEELACLVDGFFQTKHEAAHWQMQKQVAEKVLALDGQSSARAVNAILTCS